MDDFERAERKGRTIIENLIKDKVANYEFTTYRYAQIDLLVTGYNQTAAIEIKDREGYNSETIENYGGMYIMKHKYDALMFAQEESGYTPYFIAIYDDRIVIWNLNEVELQWKVKSFPKTNCGENKEEMEYVYSNLHLKDAIRYYETRTYRPIGKGQDS